MEGFYKYKMLVNGLVAFFIANTHNLILEVALIYIFCQL